VLNLSDSMIPHPSPEQSPASDNPADVSVVEPGFEVKVHAFWEKNRSLILMACVVVLLAIIGREGWAKYAEMRENDIRSEFAKIADQPEKLAGFAESHAGHGLAGVAFLKLADQKFEAADFKQAGMLYSKAADNVKNAVLLGRARLGAAMSQISSGDAAAGEASLKAVGADAALLKDARAEAYYHLAAAAIESGNSAEAKKLVDEINKIDLSGSWSQRATMLLASLPADAKSSAPSDSTVSFKP